MNNVFNPSYGARIEEFGKSAFDLCIRLPILPPACEAYNTKVVYLSTDGCFYRCIMLNDEWTWERVTHGVYRQYIFPVTPVVPTEIVPGYTATGDTVPVAGTKYYTKIQMEDDTYEYVEFTGDTFEEGVVYYVQSDYIRKWEFNDIVDRLNKLATEFSKCGVYFKNSTREMDFGTGDQHLKMYIGLNNSTFREAVRLMNEMIEHVNHVLATHLSIYTGDTSIPVADISNVMMEELINYVNALIHAVNPYSDTLTDILTKLARIVAECDGSLDSNALTQIGNELSVYRDQVTFAVRSMSNATTALNSQIFKQVGDVRVSRIDALEDLYNNLVASNNLNTQIRERFTTMLQTISSIDLSENADLSEVRAAVRSIVEAANNAISSEAPAK